MNRIKELDLTKSFIIVVAMIGVHTMYHLCELEPSVPVSFVNILATAWGAPVFMFCMGVTLRYAHRQKPSEWLRKGFHLITIGMVLNVLRYGPMAYTAYATNNPELLKVLARIFNVDIFQFAGLALMLYALFKKRGLKAGTILAISILMNIAGTLLIGHDTHSYVLNQILGYFYHTPTCSCFPLLNWFIFIAAGNVLGQIYKEGDINKAYRLILPLCGIVAAIHQYISITDPTSIFKTLQNDWEFYSMATPDALCIAFGVAPFMLAIFWLIGKCIPDRWMGVIGYPALHIKQYFCVSWVWIMWTDCFLYFLGKATTLAGFTVVWLTMTFLTTVTLILYNRSLKEKIAPCFSRHEKAWNIGIWAFLICFAILYFTNVPGPYSMPY